MEKQNLSGTHPLMKTPQYWILKTEPETFSWQDLLTTGWTHWDGVRNYQARNNLKSMAVGDIALIYHSVSSKALVGLAHITQAAYPDPTDEKWVAVRVEPLKPLNHLLTLADMKADEQLSEIALIKQGRLSVVPLCKEAFQHILERTHTTLEAPPE
jgi:predicted RNA-binding protein with PUA-like domain